MKLPKILKACRVDKPERFHLGDCDPAETFGLDVDKADVKAMLADGVAKLGNLQQRLYADGQWAVLLLFQGMDAAGKDSVIKQPYFKTTLDTTNGLRLSNLAAPQVGPDGRPYVLFTLECRYLDQIR